jgi:phosphatidylserine/phosphatidylglycerophosphate/cardiolipin synthase-like enzyme
MLNLEADSLEEPADMNRALPSDVPEKPAPVEQFRISHDTPASIYPNPADHLQYYINEFRHGSRIESGFEAASRQAHRQEYHKHTSLRKTPSDTINALRARSFLRSRQEQAHDQPLEYPRALSPALLHEPARSFIQQPTHLGSVHPGTRRVVAPTSVIKLPPSALPRRMPSPGMQRRATTTNPYVSIYQHGTTMFNALWHAIDAARVEVLYEMYAFNMDQTGTITLNKLTEAARRGVYVALIVDRFGSSSPAKELFRHFLSAGGRLVIFNDYKDIWNYSPFIRNHRKTAVIDGLVGFTGGMNTTDEYRSGTAEHGEAFKDVHMRIVGPSALQLRHVFRDSLEEEQSAYVEELSSDVQLLDMVANYPLYMGYLQEAAAARATSLAVTPQPVSPSPRRGQAQEHLPRHRGPPLAVRVARSRSRRLEREAAAALTAPKPPKPAPAVRDRPAAKTGARASPEDGSVGSPARRLMQRWRTGPLRAQLAQLRARVGGRYRWWVYSMRRAYDQRRMGPRRDAVGMFLRLRASRQQLAATLRAVYEDQLSWLHRTRRSLLGLTRGYADAAVPAASRPLPWGVRALLWVLQGSTSPLDLYLGLRALVRCGRRYGEPVPADHAALRVVGKGTYASRPAAGTITRILAQHRRVARAASLPADARASLPDAYLPVVSVPPPTRADRVAALQATGQTDAELLASYPHRRQDWGRLAGSLRTSSTRMRDRVFGFRTRVIGRLTHIYGKSHLRLSSTPAIVPPPLQRLMELFKGPAEPAAAPEPPAPAVPLPEAHPTATSTHSTATSAHSTATSAHSTATSPAPTDTLAMISAAAAAAEAAKKHPPTLQPLAPHSDALIARNLLAVPPRVQNEAKSRNTQPGTQHSCVAVEIDAYRSDPLAGDADAVKQPAHLALLTSGSWSLRNAHFEPEDLLSQFKVPDLDELVEELYRRVRVPSDDNSYTGNFTDVPLRVLFSNVWKQSKAIHDFYVTAVRGARSSVLIMNPYVIPPPWLRAELVAAAKRGVSVTLLLAGEGCSDVPQVRMATLHTYEGLLKHGVKIYEFGQRVLHAKVLVVDELHACVGSFNLDSYSSNVNLEVAVTIPYNEAIARFLADDIKSELDAAYTKHIKLRHILSRSLQHSISVKSFHAVSRRVYGYSRSKSGRMLVLRYLSAVKQTLLAPFKSIAEVIIKKYVSFYVRGARRRPMHAQKAGVISPLKQQELMFHVYTHGRKASSTASASRFAKSAAVDLANAHMQHTFVNGSMFTKARILVSARTRELRKLSRDIASWVTRLWKNDKLM